MNSRREPIFILAPARSYSTVTVALLSGHPQIYGFPELLTFNVATVGELISRRRRPGLSPSWVGRQLSGILRAVAEVHCGCQSVEAVGRAMTWLEERADWPATRLLDHLLDRVHPRIGLEKSPDTVMTTEALRTCLDAYPRARYIHLTRHPFATQRSMYQHWHKFANSYGWISRDLVTENEDALLKSCAVEWYNSHSRILTVLADIPEERWTRVRAEDLLNEPASQLPRILEWVGLNWDQAILQDMLFTERWKFAGTGESRSLYGGDHKFLNNPRLRAVPAPEPLDSDGFWRVPQLMRAPIIRLARKLGY